MNQTALDKKCKHRYNIDMERLTGQVPQLLSLRHTTFELVLRMVPTMTDIISPGDTILICRWSVNRISWLFDRKNVTQAT